jgi:hypothetical protein
MMVVGVGALARLQVLLLPDAISGFRLFLILSLLIDIVTPNV